MKYLLFIIITVLSQMAFAQSRNKVAELAHTHGTDTVWKSIVWRIIVTREASNAPLRYLATPNAPQPQFAEILLKNAADKNIRVYAPDDDSLSHPVDASYSLFNNFPQDAASYLIKEVWWFDKDAGRMGVDILTITPQAETAHYGAVRKLFTVDFQELRKYLAIPISGKEQDKKQTFADFFDNRQFSSFIIKKVDIEHPVDLNGGAAKEKPKKRR